MIIRTTKKILMTKKMIHKKFVHKKFIHKKLSRRIVGLLGLLQKQGRIHGRSRVSCFGERRVYKKRTRDGPTNLPTNLPTDIATYRVA